MINKEKIRYQQNGREWKNGAAVAVYIELFVIEVA